MRRTEVILSCLGFLILGLVVGYIARPNGLDERLDTLNANLEALNQETKNGVEVKADVDLLGLGAQRLRMYQNKADNWVVGAQDAGDKSKVDPVILFNFDWATLDTAPMPSAPAVPPTMKSLGLSSPTGQ